MGPQIRRAISEAIESAANSRPSALEFEMAYQARVAADRIRFAIRQTESIPARPEIMREAGMQLLDALQRLESIDHRFQDRSRLGAVFARQFHDETDGLGKSNESAASVIRAGGAI
jgi:hypothetical protein